MLKPSLGGTVVDGDSSSGEHTPHLITVYTRSQPADLAPAVMDQTLRFYRQAFAKSRLQISSRLLADPDLAAHVLHHQVRAPTDLIAIITTKPDRYSFTSNRAIETRSK